MGTLIRLFFKKQTDQFTFFWRKLVNTIIILSFLLDIYRSVQRIALSGSTLFAILSVSFQGLILFKIQPHFTTFWMITEKFQVSLTIEMQYTVEEKATINVMQKNR